MGFKYSNRLICHFRQTLSHRSISCSPFSLYLRQDQCHKFLRMDTVCYRLWRIMSSVAIGASFTHCDNLFLPLGGVSLLVLAPPTHLLILLMSLCRSLIPVFANKQGIQSDQQQEKGHIVRFSLSAHLHIRDTLESWRCCSFSMDRRKWPKRDQFSKESLDSVSLKSRKMILCRRMRRRCRRCSQIQQLNK